MLENPWIKKLWQRRFDQLPVITYSFQLIYAIFMHGATWDVSPRVPAI